ncbi:hypothetical protein C7212DRAFT_287539 [Tuber magnatum]|uniref:Zn(2)-C6 fungal-type domain-containing protein n=1 Tax=Tuber magnatum TaxID=42249 RepID=A0A317SB31_9PEZI|nr:hypothetical protein C7212DRAFT_287539 [Tuber magnatum]
MSSPASDLSAPLLRVSRPVSACSRCRSAKVRCDGKLPACTACEKSGKAHECTGGSDQFARGKERSYIASLESKMEKLEKKLAALESRKAPPGSMSANGFGDGNSPLLTQQQQKPRDRRSVTPGSPLPNGARAKSRKREEANEIEELVADLGYMAINATTRDFYGFARDMTFARVVLKASASSKALETKPRARLPPRHTATQLIQHYFDKIFTTLPCLNEASFFGAVDSVYRDESTCSPYDIYTVYMVLAIGTMSLSKSRDSLAAHNAACFVKSALEHADAVISPSAITGVQAALLLVQYSMLEPAHFNSWYLIGIASRIMVDLGLHQEPTKSLRKKSADMDLRRRIFYCVYTLDRSISMVLQRPFTFSDDSVLVDLPKREDPEVAKQIIVRGTLTPMAAAIHLFRLRKLQSEWYQFLHLSGSEPVQDPTAYFRSKTTVLREWLGKIPESINTSTRDWLYLEWYYLNVYTAAPCPKIPRPCDEAVVQVFQNCVNYALMFRSILQNSNVRFVYTYHDALRTYFIGNNFLHALWRSEDAVITSANVTSTIDAIKAIIFVLTSMIVRWQEVEALRDKFRMESSYMLRNLEAREQSLLAPPRPQVTREEAERTLRRQLSIEWREIDTINPRLYNPSGHIAMADFGNVAFYRYA